MSVLSVAFDHVNAQTKVGKDPSDIKINEDTNKI
jgi:hypothetical protein